MSTGLYGLYSFFYNGLWDGLWEGLWDNQDGLWQMPLETSAKGGTVELLAPVCGTNKKDHKF